MEDLTQWAEDLESTIEARGLRLFDRIFVLSATNSSQDAARRLCGSRPGAVVIAGRQLGGRGRLGRPWEQHGDLGVAVSFVVPAESSPSRLALAAGVAAAEAISAMLDGLGARVGLRWPNDVIECERGRKLAGVLIERAGPLAIVGIGVNVHQGPEDWGPHLVSKACSLHELGARADRLETIRRLMVALEQALGLPDEALLARWLELETLCGSQAELLHAGRSYRGTVEAVSPDHEILLREPTGAVVRLPASSTTLISSVFRRAPKPFS